MRKAHALVIKLDMEISDHSLSRAVSEHAMKKVHYSARASSFTRSDGRGSSRCLTRRHSASGSEASHAAWPPVSGNPGLWVACRLN